MPPASAGRPLQEPLLYEERLVDLLDRVRLLSHRHREALDAHGSAAEAPEHGLHDAAVHLVESTLVHLELEERIVSDIGGDAAVALDLSEVADPSQEPVGDAGRPAGAPRYLERAVVRYGHTEDPGRAQDYAREFIGVVVVESLRDTETRAEGRGQEPRPGRRADEREVLQVQLDATRRRALVQHDVH
jgi:hypothetical protein